MSPARLQVSDEELAQRKTTGIDRWDEVWDGVWYMTPAPTFEHERMVDAMIAFLVPRLNAKEQGLLVSGINVLRDVEGWANYRIPDLTFITKGREHIVCEDGVRAAGPDAVIEIRSPGDDTYEKLPFYAAIGTREVIIINRDTKSPEIHRLSGREFVTAKPDANGWLLAETMSLRFRKVDAQPPRLRIEDRIDSAASVEI